MTIKEIKEAVDNMSQEQKNSLKKDLYLDVKSKGVLDALQEKVVSRKLLVFGTATGLFIWSGLDPNIWGMIAMCYIGGQSAIDFAKVWKSSNY